MRDIIVIRGKCIFKTAKGHQLKEKKKKREKRERQWRIRLERGVQNLEETIILRWPYLQHPPLDHAEFVIYFSAHTPLLTDRRDLKEHNPFNTNHHLNVSGKQKEIILQSSFGCPLISLSSTVGSCSFLDIWCGQMLPSIQTVEIGNTFSGKVLVMLNSSSFIFRLARFYSDLGRSNRWIIMLLRYIVPNAMICSLTVGFKTIIRGW